MIAEAAQPVKHYPRMFDAVWSDPSIDTRLLVTFADQGWFSYRPLPSAWRFHASLARYRLAIGGNRCIGPETIIEGPDGNRRVCDIKGPHRVWAWDEVNKCRVIANAGTPFIKAYEQMYRVTMTDGRWFDCTANHRVLTTTGWLEFGTFANALQLLPESFAFLPQTTSGNALSNHPPDAGHCSHTSEDFQSGYHPSRRSYGEQLPSDQDSVQVIVPSQGDAPIRSEACRESCGQTDDAGNRSEYSRACFEHDRLSSPDGRLLSVAQHDEPECHVVGTVLKYVGSQFQADQLPIDVFYPTRSIGESDQSAKAFHVSKPCLVSPDGVNIATVEIHYISPVYDFQVDHYHNYIHAGVISHNSSKSESLAAEVVLLAIGEHPFRDYGDKVRIAYGTVSWSQCGKILCEKVFRFLGDYPYKVSWHNKADNIAKRITLGNGAVIEFFAYEQDRQNLQGTEYNLIAFDEQPPQDIYLEMITRIGAGRAADVAMAYTPLEPSEFLEAKEDSPSDETEIFYFPLDDNRVSRGGFVADANVDSLLKEWPDEVQATRRLGKRMGYLGSVYKSFVKSIHVVKIEDEGRFFPHGQMPVDSQLIGGIDWGAANPFCFLWAFKPTHMENTWFIADEYYWPGGDAGIRLISQHHAEIMAKTKDRFPGTQIYRVWSDHDVQDRFEFDTISGNDSECVLPQTQPALKDVRAGIECVQRYVKVMDEKTRFYVSERCVNLVKQMGSYRYPDSIKGRNVDENRGPEKKNDHACLRGDTLVKIRGMGWHRIESIPSHGEVWTPLGWKPYIACKMHDNAPLLEAAFDDGFTVAATEEHLFLTEDLAWDTIGYLKGASYESNGFIKHATGISRPDVLAMRSVFSEIREASASSGVGASSWINSRRLSCASQKRKSARQSGREFATEDRKGSSVRAYDTGATSGGISEHDRESDTSRCEMAQIGSRERLSSTAWQGVMEQRTRTGVCVSGVQERIQKPITSKNREVLPFELQDESVVRQATGGRVVVKKRQVESAAVYDLKVEDAHCFYLRNGIVSHNCDALRYIIFSEEVNKLPAMPKFEPLPEFERTFK